MRCFVIQDKDKQCIAQGVVFHDRLAIVRSISGQISIYPNYDDYEKSLLDQGYWCQIRDVDDWVNIKEREDTKALLGIDVIEVEGTFYVKKEDGTLVPWVAKPSNNKDNLEQAMKLRGPSFSY
jgi:hypothetical protein